MVLLTKERVPAFAHPLPCERFEELHKQRHGRACSRLLSFDGSARNNSLLSPLSTSRMYPLVGTRISLRARDRSTFSALNALPFSDDVQSAVTLGTVLATLIGFGGFRTFVYFRMQYMIAAMLGRYVPRGGSKVLDMDIHEGRSLYYYPSDVGEVVAVTTEKNRELIKNQAIRAGVPVDVKVKALTSLSLPSNSMDAVVSIYCLCNLKEEEVRMALREAVRLLKPGKPFVFVENVEAAGEFLRTCQLLLQRVLQLLGVHCTSPKNLSKMLEEAQGLEKLSYETVFSYQDPHIVGLAVKQMETADGKSKKRGIRKAVSV